MWQNRAGGATCESGCTCMHQPKDGLHESTPQVDSCRLTHRRNPPKTPRATQVGANSLYGSVWTACGAPAAFGLSASLMVGAASAVPCGPGWRPASSTPSVEEVAVAQARPGQPEPCAPTSCIATGCRLRLLFSHGSHLALTLLCPPLQVCALAALPRLLPERFRSGPAKPALATA